MNKKLYQLFFVMGFVLLFVMFSGVANAQDVDLELSIVDQDTVISPNEQFSHHFEYGDVLRNGQVIGNYRISGIGYCPMPDDESIKSGDIYLEIYGMGYLFLKIMTNASEPDYFEGIITGGTGSLVSAEGTASGRILQESISITLHLR